jgi:hypothetical protein
MLKKSTSRVNLVRRKLGSTTTRRKKSNSRALSLDDEKKERAPPPVNTRLVASHHALSSDVLHLMYSFLSWKELCACSCVCTAWRAVKQLEYWRNLYYLTFAPKSISKVCACVLCARLITV